MNTVNTQTEIKSLVSQEFLRMKNINPAFSLRAFAKRLGVHASALSEVFNGKRQISLTMAEKLLLGIKVGPENSERLLQNFKDERKALRFEKKSFKSQTDYVALDMGMFHHISEWYHFALLSLVETEDFQSSFDWIGRRLKISSEMAERAVETLIRFNLLQKSDAGEISGTGQCFKTLGQGPNEYLRKVNYENLDLAKKVLEERSLEERDFSAITMAIDKSKIPLAKNRIKEFRRELSEILEAGNKKEVYRLCIQLLPLTYSLKE